MGRNFEAKRQMTEVSELMTTARVDINLTSSWELKLTKGGLQFSSWLAANRESARIIWTAKQITFGIQKKKPSLNRTTKTCMSKAKKLMKGMLLMEKKSFWMKKLVVEANLKLPSMNAQDSVFVTHLIQRTLSRPHVLCYIEPVTSNMTEIKRALAAQEVPDRCF